MNASEGGIKGRGRDCPSENGNPLEDTKSPCGQLSLFWRGIRGLRGGEAGNPGKLAPSLRALLRGTAWCDPHPSTGQAAQDDGITIGKREETLQVVCMTLFTVLLVSPGLRAMKIQEKKSRRVFLKLPNPTLLRCFFLEGILASVVYDRFRPKARATEMPPERVGEALLLMQLLWLLSFTLKGRRGGQGASAALTCHVGSRVFSLQVACVGFWRKDLAVAAHAALSEPP